MLLTGRNLVAIIAAIWAVPEFPILTRCIIITQQINISYFNQMHYNYSADPPVREGIGEVHPR